jgi:imidazolonepropionase-like amidohydrolase
LQPGKYADIVAVAGNPLAGIQATEHLVFVMKEAVVCVAGARSH